MAHRPPIFKNMWAMLTELAEEGVLPKRYLELASSPCRCSTSAPIASPTTRRSSPLQGISEAGAAGLLDYKAHPELDEIDKLVVEYAIAVTNDWNRTRDEIFTRLRAHFTEAQIVELTWRTALCGAFNRFNDILQLDIEPGVAVREAAE